MMNKNNRGFAWLALLWLALFAAFALLCSCRTVRTEEIIFVHDTLRVNTTDTVQVEKVSHLTDTVREKEITRIILKESGDTIKV